VNRRELLSRTPLALAGCIGTGVETPSRSRRPPNYFTSFDRLSEHSAYRVTFDRGNVLTADETA